MHVSSSKNKQRRWLFRWTWRSFQPNPEGTQKECRPGSSPFSPFAAHVCYSVIPFCASEKKCESKLASGPGRTGPTGDSLSNLISLQQADGSWKLDDVIAKVLSKSLKELSDACPVKCDGGVATLWATILCVVYLELKHPSQKDEWELIAMKAELWLDGQSLPAGADLNAMKTAARKIIA